MSPLQKVASFHRKSCMKKLYLAPLTVFSFYILTSQFCLGMEKVRYEIIEDLPLVESEKEHIKSLLEKMENKNVDGVFFIPLFLPKHRDYYKQMPHELCARLVIRSEKKNRVFPYLKKEKASINLELINLSRFRSWGTLQSVIPLNHLPEIFCHQEHLTELILESHELTELPETFSQLTSLRRLSLSLNPLKIFPQVIILLTNLEDLSVSGTEIKELPEELGRLTKLTRLSARNNNLKSLPKGIGDLKSLRALLISKNEFSTVPETLGNLGINMKYVMQDIMSHFPDKEFDPYSSSNIFEFLRFSKVFAHEIFFIFEIKLDQHGEMKDINSLILWQLFQLHCKDNPFLAKYYQCLSPGKHEICTNILLCEGKANSSQLDADL